MNMVGGYNRKMSYKKAKRKKRISDDVHRILHYDNLHQYSKNKIHCSCSMCTRKTNNKGKNRLKPGNYSPSKDWKHSDLIKIDFMDFSEEEYNEEKIETSAS